MPPSVALAVLLALAQSPSTDTTISVPPDARLEIRNHRGDVVVRTWDRAALRVQAEHSSAERIDIRASAAVVTVSARSARGAPRAVDFVITAPVGMALSLSGTYADISVEGTRGRVLAETVHGDVTVRGGRGLISIRSVEGDVHLGDASGRIELKTVNGEIDLRGAEGEVYAETVNGDITLRGVQSDNVSATTVNGDLDYDGTIRDGGRYRFSTHNGDVDVRVSPRANVTVSVSTFNGDFESAFPITLTETARGGKRFTFTLGSGSGRLELASFQGSIRLLRP